MTPDDIERAAEAARLVFKDRSAVAYEPTGPLECLAAVETLIRCIEAAGDTFADMAEGALEMAGVLSDDLMQGVAEIVQNPDDAGATNVHFHQLDDSLVAVHNARTTRRGRGQAQPPHLDASRSRASPTTAPASGAAQRRRRDPASPR